MKLGWRIAAITGGVVAVGVLALVFRTLNTAGVFSDVTPGFAGTCQTVRGVTGAEDIAIDRLDGLAFISATDRRAHKPGEPVFKDGIYLFRPDHPELGVTLLSGAPQDFHPHGISLYRAGDGSLTLMAVNHRSTGHSSIDIFNVDVKRADDGTFTVSLEEQGSVESSAIFSPNDVAATGIDSFYVTNDHTSRTSLGMFLENYLILPRANVVYYNGQIARVVADGLHYANGVALSNDHTKLYVAETLGRDIRTYNVQPVSGSLTLANEYSLPAGLDNIDVDAKGDLWVAGHPKLLDFVAYASDPTKPSPSEVFEVTTANGIPTGSKAVYTNLGKQIGASSVGAYESGHLLIGSVFDPKILDCKLQ